MKTPESNEIHKDREAKRPKTKQKNQNNVEENVRSLRLRTRVRNHIDGEDKLGSNVQQLMSTDVHDDEKRQNVVCWPLLENLSLGDGDEDNDTANATQF